MTRHHLRDATHDCGAVAPLPGERLACERPAGHDGPHQSDQSRWTSPKPTTHVRYRGTDGQWHSLHVQMGDPR